MHSEGNGFKLKIAFATCVQLGKSCIDEIYQLDGKIDLLITLQDDLAKNKSGRVYLDDIATKESIPLLKIKNINDDSVVEALKKNQIDWFFIIGWSQIAKKGVLDAPKKGCIGMHPTLLPKGRGRASVPWAIIKGLDQTGVTMFKLDPGVDTGGIIDQEIIPLTSATTATELYEKVNQAHIQLIKKNWKAILNDTVSLSKQDETNATEWAGRTPKDGEILHTMTMVEADRLIRGTTHPYPGAFIKNDEGKTIIWKAAISKEKGDFQLLDGYLHYQEVEVVSE